MLAAAGKEDETTGEEEVGGGGAPGNTPALGAAALFGEVLGAAASPFALALVLVVVDRVVWQILQLFRRSL